jgi:rSAM/selenodomain-associated transferase 1
VAGDLVSDHAPDAGIAVVVVAKAPRPGLAKTRLEPLLGPAGCARLQAALIARAARWAVAAAAPGAAYLAFTPTDASDELDALVGPQIERFAQVDGHLGTRLAAAFAEASERSGRPVVLIGTDLPGLAGHHAWAAADDLAHGVDVTFGPATDGGYYLIGARRPHPALFAIDADAWGGERVLGLSMESVVGAGLSIGWLRSERDLDTPADAAALLADPRTPADVRAALAP